MSNNNFHIKETDEGLVFKIFVQPKSSKNMIAGIREDAVKIKIQAPPVDGAANKMCIKFISKILGIPKSKIKIKSGQSARTKLILIEDNVRIDQIKNILS